MKNLRRLALSRIRDDSTLSRQYWTASGDWKRRIWIVLAWFILPVLALIVAILIAFLGALLGSGNLAPDQAAAYLLVVAVIATVVAFAHTGWTLRELIGSRSLAVFSVLPDLDRDFARGRTVNSIQKTLLFLVGSLLLGGGVAFGAELNLSESVQVVLLAALLWAMVASVSVIIPAFFPGLVRQEMTAQVIGLSMMLVFSAGALVVLGFARASTLISVALMILPTGWPILMIDHSVIRGQPEYWWLLIPSATVVIFAAYSWFRLLARYQIREFSYEPGSLAIAEFGAETVSVATENDSQSQRQKAAFESLEQTHPSNTSEWLRDRRRWIRKWLKLPDAEEAQTELARDEAIDRIRESGLTKRFAWSESGFVERAMARILGENELLAAEILSSGEPKWSVAMTRALVPASAAVLLVVLAAIVIDRKIAVISGHVALGGLIGAFAGSRLASQWRSDSGDFCSALALLPIDPRHVSRMLMTLGAIRSLLIFPLAAGVMMAITWGHSGEIRVVDSAIVGGKAALVLFAVHQWWFLTMQPFSHSKSVMKAIFDILAAVMILGGMVAGVCLLLMSGNSEIWSTAGAGFMFGGGWLVRKLQLRRVLMSPTDFVFQVQSQRVAVQRQQQSRQTRRVPTFWPRPVEQPELSS